jgi:hypothetical protein
LLQPTRLHPHESFFRNPPPGGKLSSNYLINEKNNVNEYEYEKLENELEDESVIDL